MMLMTEMVPERNGGSIPTLDTADSPRRLHQNYFDFIPSLSNTAYTTRVENVRMIG
jgi:hypothetical protein